MSEFQKSQAVIDNQTDIKSGLILTAITIVLCSATAILMYNNIVKHFG